MYRHPAIDLFAAGMWVEMKGINCIWAPMMGLSCKGSLNRKRQFTISGIGRVMVARSLMSAMPATEPTSMCSFKMSTRVTLNLYIRAAAITTFPDLWAAAIDVVGIVNWVTFLENTGTWCRAHREREYGSLDADREFLESISPIHKLDLIEAPIMVVHGANDPRVPVTEADHVVDHLRKRNHPLEYLRYDDEGHKISKIDNRIDSFTKMAAFV